jgi:hypothetical protein
VQDGVLNYTKGKTDERADVSLTLSRDTLNRMMAGEISPKQAIDSGLLVVEGSKLALVHFLLLLDDADPSFPIVTPRSDSERAWSGAEKFEDIKDKAIEVLMDHPKIAKARDLIGELPRGC